MAPDDPLDDRLRRLVAEASADAPVPPEPGEMRNETTPARPGRQTWWLPLAAAGMAAAAIAAIVLIPRSTDDAEVVPAGTETVPPAPSVVISDPVGSDTTTPATTPETASTAPDPTLPGSTDVPSTTTTPVPAAPTVLAAMTTDGDAVLVPVDGADPITLFDGPDPDEPVDEGPGPNVVDLVALSPDGATAWVGLCCEPAAGVVLRGSPAGIPNDGTAPVDFGYGPAVSPDGRLLAIGSIAGPALTITDLTTGERLDAPDFGDEVGGFTPFDTVWLDDRRVVGIGTATDESGPEWVAVPMVVDGSSVTVGETLRLDEVLTVEGDSIVRAAGVIDGDRFAVHVEGRSAGAAIEFRLDGATRASAASSDPDREFVPGDVGGPARSIWYRLGAPTVWVGTDGVLHRGDEVVPGSYLWARPTDATGIVTTSAAEVVADAIDLEDASVFGLSYGEAVEFDRTFADVSTWLGVPIADTGWQLLPEDFGAPWRACFGDRFRTVWWGDLRLTFEETGAAETRLAAWSVGDPDVEPSAPVGPVPPDATSSGVAADGVGIGAPRDEVVAVAEATGRMLLDEPDRVVVTGAVVTTFAFGDDDRVTGIGSGRLDCTADAG